MAKTIAEQVKEEYDAQKKTNPKDKDTGAYNKELAMQIAKKYNPECMMNCDDLYECLGERDEVYILNQISTKNMAVYSDRSAVIMIHPYAVGTILEMYTLKLRGK